MLVIQWLHNVRVLHRGSHLPSFTTDKVQVSESAKKNPLEICYKNKYPVNRNLKKQVTL